MPYIDLISGDDYASIWYNTNSPAMTVSGFDPSKPTLVMLHPFFLDSTWTHPQLDDHRLNANFNIIVFDTRTTGKSLFRHGGRYDLWVNAADLAHCFYVSASSELWVLVLSVEHVRMDTDSTSTSHQPTSLRPSSIASPHCASPPCEICKLLLPCRVR